MKKKRLDLSVTEIEGGGYRVIDFSTGFMTEVIEVKDVIELAALVSKLAIDAKNEGEL